MCLLACFQWNGKALNTHANILLLFESKCSPRCFLLKQIDELSWVPKLVPSCLSKGPSTEFLVQELSHGGIISPDQCSALPAVIIQPRNMIIPPWDNSSKRKSADLPLGKAVWHNFGNWRSNPFIFLKIKASKYNTHFYAPARSILELLNELFDSGNIYFDANCLK